MNEAMELAPARRPSICWRRQRAVRGRLKFTARAAGKSVEMRLVEIYAVRDGLITELDVYYKDSSAVAALLAA